MSAQSVHVDPEASLQSSDSEPEGQAFSSLEKTKVKKRPVQTWNFQYTDLLGQVASLHTNK